MNIGIAVINQPLMNSAMGAPEVSGERGCFANARKASERAIACKTAAHKGINQME